MWIVRLLGVRTLPRAPQNSAALAGTCWSSASAVDVAHAASMLAAAKVWPRYRRAALISAASATASAVVGAVLTGILQ